MVISACAVSAGDFKALNVIPDNVRIGGTARAYSPAVRDQIEAEIGNVARGVAATFGIAVDYSFLRRIPPVVNDPQIATRALHAAQAATGRPVITDFPPSTAGDDFAEFGNRVPGTYVWLGNGPAVDGALHHNSRYDFNDGAILTGAKFWATMVQQELAQSELGAPGALGHPLPGSGLNCTNMGIVRRQGRLRGSSLRACRIALQYA